LVIQFHSSQTYFTLKWEGITQLITRARKNGLKHLGISVPVPLKINAGNSVAFLVGPQVDFLVGASVKDASDNKVKNEDDFDQVDIATSQTIDIFHDNFLLVKMKVIGNNIISS
jgi:hypothetical protein